jgi:hypothetical protein
MRLRKVTVKRLSIENRDVIWSVCDIAIAKVFRIFSFPSVLMNEINDRGISANAVAKSEQRSCTYHTWSMNTIYANQYVRTVSNLPYHTCCTQR